MAAVNFSPSPTACGDEHKQVNPAASTHEHHPTMDSIDLEKAQVLLKEAALSHAKQSSEAIASLQSSFRQSPQIAVAAAEQAVEILKQDIPVVESDASSVNRFVEGCRMVRAICLAGGMPQLQEKGVHSRLMQVLVHPTTDPRALSSAAEALLSCALRSSCVGDAFKDAPLEQVKQLIALFNANTPAQGVQNVLVPASSQQPDNTQHTASEPSTTSAQHAAVVHSLLRLTTSLVGHAGAMTALLAAGLLSNLIDLAVNSKPTQQLHSGWSMVQTNTLSFILKFSHYPQLHNSMLAAGVAQKIPSLMTLTASAQVQETCVAIIGNIAHSSAASQSRLVQAGVVAPLVSLLASKHQQVVASTADTLANLMLQNAQAQRHLASFRCVFPGVPDKLGKEEVTKQSEGRNSTSPTSQSSNGVAALVRLLGTSNPVLMAKVLRALGNAVLGCSSNQHLLLTTGILPLLLKLAQAPDHMLAIARQAVGLLTNLVPGCDAARTQCIELGITGVIAKLLSRKLKQSEQQPAGTDAVEAETGSTARIACDDLMERCCLLTGNLAAGNMATKKALVDAGLIPLLIALIGAPLTEPSPTSGDNTDSSTNSSEQQAAEDYRSRVSVAACGALSNLVLHAPAIATDSLNHGLLPVLLSLVEAPGQSPEVVSRALITLGSTALHSEPVKAAALQSGAATVIITLAEQADTPAQVRSACCRGIGHIATASPISQEQLASAGAVQAVLAALQDPSSEVVSAALGALSSVTAGCTAAQDRFLAVDKGADLVVSYLAPSNTATTVSLTCAVVHALTMPPSARQTGNAKDDEHDVGVAGALTADVVALYSSATVHNMQKRLAEAGALTHLATLLRAVKQDILDTASVALCNLLAGNKDVQTKMAASGGVVVLKALLDRLDSSKPAFARHVVDAWLELGGATAAVKLLNHARPVVVEMACWRIASTVSALTAAAQNSQFMELKAKAGIATAQAGMESTKEWSACTWLVGAHALDKSIAEVASDAVAALIKADAPAKLITTCTTYLQTRVVAAALVALRSLLMAGGETVRTALLTAGAQQALQALQIAAAATGAKQSAKGASTAGGIAPPQRGVNPLQSRKSVPHAFGVGSPGGIQLGTSPSVMLKGEWPAESGVSKAGSMASGIKAGSNATQQASRLALSSKGLQDVGAGGVDNKDGNAAAGGAKKAGSGRPPISPSNSITKPLPVKVVPQQPQPGDGTVKAAGHHGRQAITAQHVATLAQKLVMQLAVA